MALETLQTRSTKIKIVSRNGFSARRKQLREKWVGQSPLTQGAGGGLAHPLLPTKATLTLTIQFWGGDSTQGKRFQVD